MKKAILVLGIIGLFSSCLKNDSKCTATDSPLIAPSSEVTSLQNYCAANAPSAVAHSSGIFYEILTPGSGANANICSNVSVRYAGYIIGGSSTPFDNSSTAVTFALSRLIVGWQKGIPLVKAGGSIRLYIPPTLGYGSAGSPPTIPPNSYLRFDIQVDDVK
ncbi:MAG: FKBP-type peptidyl-prolyl cis-trans isomerase [Ferruginibacter sp.]|nr:FKBP-type peptidyl-prolyl cis-trans isomerase [Ferruginibacter sp.]